jgi:hypothetical protein
LFVAPADWLWAASVLVTPPEPVTAGRLEATAAPLVLRCQWQFFSRAALPARAP